MFDLNNINDDLDKRSERITEPEVKQPPRRNNTRDFTITDDQWAELLAGYSQVENVDMLQQGDHIRYIKANGKKVKGGYIVSMNIPQSITLIANNAMPVSKYNRIWRANLTDITQIFKKINNHVNIPTAIGTQQPRPIVSMDTKLLNDRIDMLERRVIEQDTTINRIKRALEIIHKNTMK